MNKMTSNDALKTFRCIYPEPEIEVKDIRRIGKDDRFVLTALFPDGKFFFEIGEGYVSEGRSTDLFARGPSDFER